MRLKFYAPLAAHNTEATRAKMLAFYETYMGARVVKSNHHHTNMHLFDAIDFYVCNGGTFTFPGYHIIRFTDAEVALFTAAVAQLRLAAARGLISVSLDMYRGPWKTTLFEFTDPYHITWVLEVSSATL